MVYAPSMDNPFPPIRRIGVDNWTEKDFEREWEWRKACSAVTADRRQILERFGWTLHRDRRRAWATLGEDPTEKTIPEAMEAVKKAGAAWPSYPPKPEFPPSSQGLFRGDVEVKPMELPKSPIFDLALKWPKDET